MLQIERVRLADHEPLALELLYLDARRFDGITAVLGESESLYQLLRSGYGVELAWAEETIEAATVAEREAALLGITVGAPVLLLCRQSFDGTGHPVEFVRSVYRADRFRFHTRLQPVGASAGAGLPPGTRLRPAAVADAPALARVFVAAWRAGYPGILEPAVLDSLDEEDIADWLGTLTSSNGPRPGWPNRPGRSWPSLVTARTPRTVAGAISTRSTSLPKREGGALPRRSWATTSGSWPKGA